MRHQGALLGAGAALAALAYDPRAAAADIKRPLVLLAAAAALSVALSRARGAPSGRGSSPSGRPIPLAAALWLAFVAWSALSLAWGVPLGAGALASWAGAAGLMLAATQFGEGAARRAAGVSGVAIGGGSALVACIQYATGGRGFAVHGGHGNPNWLGLIIAIALPLSLDLTLSLRREGARAWPAAAALTALQAPALYLSHSRVAWAAASLSLLGWAAAAGLALARRRSGAGALAAALLALTCFAGAGVALWRAQPAGVDAPVAHASDPGEDSALAIEDVPIGAAWDGRTWIWVTSADAARRVLPLGAGLGGFAHVFLEAQTVRLAPVDPKVASRRFTNATTAHCDWIEVVVEGGAAGIALFLAAVATGLLRAVRGRWPGGAAALGAFAIAALGDSPLHQPAASVLVALALAAVPAPRDKPSRSAPARARGPLLRVFALTISLAAAAILLATSTRSWLATRRLTAARDAEPRTRLSLLERAVRLDPWCGEAALALGLTRLEMGDASGALQALKQSQPLLANVGTDVAIGNAHVALGAPDRAEAAYRRALRHNPGSFRAHANITEALMQLGRLDDAAAHLAIARGLWPGHPKLLAIAERLRQARLDEGVDVR